MKKFLSTFLATIILASSSLLAVTSYAVTPSNQLSVSYANGQYSSYILPEDSITDTSYQQVEYISGNGSGSFFSFTNIRSAYFKGFGLNTFLNVYNPFTIKNSYDSSTWSGLLQFYFNNSTLNYIYPNKVINIITNNSNVTGSVNTSFSGSVPHTFSYTLNNYSESSKKTVYSMIASVDGSQVFSRSDYTAEVSAVNVSFSSNTLTTYLGNSNGNSGFTCFTFNGYVPCYRKSDGLIGFYNSTNSSFITPNNQNGIYCGPDVLSITQPVISDQSGNFSLYLTGASPELHVIASTEMGNLSYQWQSSFPDSMGGYTTWSDISDATSYLYTPSTFTEVGIYKYRCIVTSSRGTSSLSTISNEMQISVVLADPDIPIIDTQPQSATYYDNATSLISLSVSAHLEDETEGALSYQWQLKDSFSVWRDISGETGTSLSLSSISGQLGTYEYRCIVSNTLASVTASSTSSTAVIQIIDYNPFEDFWTSFFGTGSSGLTAVTDLTSTYKNYNFNNLPQVPRSFLSVLTQVTNNFPVWFFVIFFLELMASGVIMVLKAVTK